VWDVNKATVGKKFDKVLGTYMQELAYTINLPKLPFIEKRKHKLIRKMLIRSHKLTGKPQPLYDYRTNETEWV
jgi:hypothetical protein